jgi:hypothetical protein
MENLEALKEGLENGSVMINEDEEINELIDILEENGYEATDENIAALIEGLENGSIAIEEDNLDLSPIEMDDSEKIAPAGTSITDPFGLGNSDNEIRNDITGDLKIFNRDVSGDDKGYVDNVIDPAIDNPSEAIGDLTVDISTPKSGITIYDYKEDENMMNNDPLKEAMDDIMGVFATMKLSEECCDGGIDDEVVSGGGLATGDTELVTGIPAGSKKVNPLVNGGVYVPARAKKNTRPKTIKEAVLLTPAYFTESSFEVVTPEDKENRLTTQLAIKIAKEKMDPMFQELLKAATEAKKLQDAIVAKYKDDAASKAGQITGKVDENKDAE